MYVDLSETQERELVPGYHVRFVHSQTMTLAFWRVEAGAALPAHSHPHEQVAQVLEGRFELVVDGEPFQLGPGEVVVIPGGVPHTGRALTDCRLLDVFHPVREDYLPR